MYPFVRAVSLGISSAILVEGSRHLVSLLSVGFLFFYVEDRALCANEQRTRLAVRHERSKSTADGYRILLLVVAK